MSNSCSGCSNCPYRPGDAEEWAMAKQDPTTYCPDAYSDRASGCNLYDHSKNKEVM